MVQLLHPYVTTGKTIALTTWTFVDKVMSWLFNMPSRFGTTGKHWTIEKVECQRTDAFELWCWRRLLRVPWTARRFNQSILKKISPGCSFEGLMDEAETPIFWPPDVKSCFTGKDPDAGKD